MEEGFESHSEKNEHSASLDRFEKMLKENKHYFFDVEEFEGIIDHYLEKSDTKKVKKVLDISLAQHPSSSLLKLKQAQYFSAIHKPNKAIAILSVLENLEPFNSEIVYIKATIYSQMRQHVKAIENYFKAAKLTNDKIEKTNIHISIVFEYENLGQFDKALELLKRILIKNPENETALYEIAFCYNLKNDTESGIQFFQKFLDEYPYSYPAWYNLGVAYTKAQLYEKAVDAYDFAIAIKEDFSSSYFNKANCYAHMEKYEEAIAIYRETFSYEEPDATTHYYIGECYEKLDDMDNAYSNYSQAVKLDPFYADAWAGMAIISEFKDKQEDALFYIKKAINLESNNSEFYYIYGDILAKKDALEEAIRVYTRVVELDEDNEDIWIDLAEVIKERDGIEQGIITLYEGLKNQPKNYAIHARLVAYLLKNGNTQEAVKNLIIVLANNKKQIADLKDYFPEVSDYPEIVELIENFDA